MSFTTTGAGHFVTQCVCGRVIAQCRCPGPKMVNVIGPCRCEPKARETYTVQGGSNADRSAD